MGVQGAGERGKQKQISQEPDEQLAHDLIAHWLKVDQDHAGEQWLCAEGVGCSVSEMEEEERGGAQGGVLGAAEEGVSRSRVNPPTLSQQPVRSLFGSALANRLGFRV